MSFSRYFPRFHSCTGTVAFVLLSLSLVGTAAAEHPGNHPTPPGPGPKPSIEVTTRCALGVDNPYTMGIEGDQDLTVIVHVSDQTGDENSLDTVTGTVLPQYKSPKVPGVPGPTNRNSWTDLPPALGLMAADSNFILHRSLNVCDAGLPDTATALGAEVTITATDTNGAIRVFVNQCDDDTTTDGIDESNIDVPADLCD